MRRSIRQLISEGRRVLEYTGAPQSTATGALSQGTYSFRPTDRMPAAGPSYPFRTRAAEDVFALAKDLVVDYPEAGPIEILRMAVPAAGYAPYDLTAEDIQLLKMAIDWLQNGPPKQLAVGVGSTGREANWDQIATEGLVPGSGYDPVLHGRHSIPRGTPPSFFEVPGVETDNDRDDPERYERWQAMLNSIRQALAGRQKKRTTTTKERREDCLS